MRLLVLLLLFTSCSTSNNVAPVPVATSHFASYWFAGKAEINSYTLRQSRYGEVREGKAAFIFVTEDFHRTRLTKADLATDTPDDTLKVLKLNRMHQFQTGIYPYSLLTSVFSPLGQLGSVKATTSAQEWCGHSWLEFSKAADKWSYWGSSYFGNEAYQQGKLKNVWLEDELFTYARLSPANLPTGTFSIVPGQQWLRLAHLPIEALPASATVATTETEIIYDVTYTGTKRTLRITLAKEPPYTLLKYTENWQGKRGNAYTSAVLDTTLQLPYWELNSRQDTVWQKALGW
jgi:hypothetical protein